MLLSESDTRAKLITPKLRQRGWSEEMIAREESPGGIEIGEDDRPRRGKKRTDYLLQIKAGDDSRLLTVALIEAKRESQPPDSGLEQAKEYAKCARLNIPFVYSTNGHLFVEFDRASGKTSAACPLLEFPTPDELRRRYQAAVGFSLNESAASPLMAKCEGGKWPLRYYQDAAIRAALEKLARDEKSGNPGRALLSLATGAGKTFIAVQLLRQIAEAGKLTRALFLCDRSQLREQALAEFRHSFRSEVAAAEETADGKNAAATARIHIATYQTLGIDEDGDSGFMKRHYPQNHFSHIIIDECHRSAWNKWSEVLRRNQDAAQIGLTATPRELKIDRRVKKYSDTARDFALTQDNIRYFGEPVYEYRLAQAAEDGHLALCRIDSRRISIDPRGVTQPEIIPRNPVDARTGERVDEKEIRDVYEAPEFESNITLPDRVRAMCADLFGLLAENDGPEQKAIIFCVGESHANAVTAAMNNLYADWCKEERREPVEDYAFKCTAAADGNRLVADFRGDSHNRFIATTIDLLSTGVDIPRVRNIVFFRYIKSPILFWQMLGRGTRIHAESGKLMFRAIDYTGVADLLGGDFVSASSARRNKPKRETDPKKVIRVEGFDIEVTPAGISVMVEEDGVTKRISLTEYRRHLSERLVAEVKNIGEFRARWTEREKRRQLMDSLTASGYSPMVAGKTAEREGRVGVDLYDTLADLGWRVGERTRRERAESFAERNAAWLKNFDEKTRATLLAIVEQFARGGTDELESERLFGAAEVVRAGGLMALQKFGDPAKLLLETKQRLFAA